MKPVVAFRCVVNGCGRMVAGLFLQDGRPVMGWYAGNSGTRPNPDHTADEPWIIVSDVEATDDAVRAITCIRHGAYLPTAEELLEHWRRGRAGEPEVRLDRDRMKSLKDLDA